MKTVNGIHATRQIHERFLDARIIIVINYNDQTFREPAREAYTFGYVLKENLLEVRQILQA